MVTISSIKTEKILLSIFYLLPVFLGIGAFIPNFFLIIFSLAFIYLLLTKKINKKIFQNSFIKILLLFWLISIISSFFSENKIGSLISSISYLRFICFAIIVHWFLEKKKTLMCSKTLHVITLSDCIINKLYHIWEAFPQK